MKVLANSPAEEAMRMILQPSAALESRIAVRAVRIASLNADKPYNEFVKEQLAGDEMAEVSGQRVGTRRW